MKGSQLEMLKLVSSINFLDVMNNLLKSSNGEINANDNWIPVGFQNQKEAELKIFLKEYFNTHLANEITLWWLHKAGRTPNWDLISTCTINGKKGIFLVEAKAHADELIKESKGKPYDENTKSEGTKRNQEQITKAIEQANNGINKEISRINISIGKCYQLSNRIAHAWWLANQGIPVVLIYLGFLNCKDMENGKNRILKNSKDWEDCFINHAKLVSADKLIGKTVNCGKSSFVMICGSIKN